MSKDLAKEKRVQAAISLAGAGLGLSALGTKGGATAVRQLARRAPAIASKLRLTPKVADKLDRTSVGLVTTGAGVGGAGGIHFARLQRNEAKREEVRKDYDARSREAERARLAAQGRHDYQRALASGRFLMEGQAGPKDKPGDDGRVRVAPQQPKPKPKLRKMKPGGIVPEQRRQRRMKAEEIGLAAGSAGAGVAAAGYGVGAKRTGAWAKASESRAAKMQSRGNQQARTASNWRGQSTRSGKLMLKYKGDEGRVAHHAAQQANQTAEAGRWAKRSDSSLKAAARSNKMAFALKTVSRKRGKQAVLATAASAAMGAGAYGMNRSRKKGQGRHYSDWWDG